MILGPGLWLVEAEKPLLSESNRQPASVQRLPTHPMKVYRISSLHLLSILADIDIPVIMVNLGDCRICTGK